ncbi:MAG: mucoidy inhibitor MuiA family protein [Myxococcales bacterium]|nr:mucoidy inhibitor MuiA family protein [Myxococcales bacterium]
MRRLAVAALLTLAPPLGAAEVPRVAAGPALYEAAEAVSTPITEVVVYSDRARVTRRGTAKLAPGVHAVRLSDLPGTTLLDTLRLGAEGAEVLRVEAGPVLRVRAGLDRIEALLDDVETRQAAIAALVARRQVLEAEQALVDRFGPEPLPGDEETPTPAVDPSGWAPVRRFVDARRTAVAEQIAAIDAALREAGEALAEVQAELRRYDAAAFTPVQRVEVRAVLRVTRANPELSLDAFVRGASWTPAYTVELLDGGEAVVLRAAGRVTQTTGEDWVDARLSLSTAIPGQGIEAPTLDTWTLGESRDFTPTPRAAHDPAGQPLAPIAPQPGTDDVLRGARLAALQARLGPALSDPEIGFGGLGVVGTGVGGGGYGAGAGRVAPARPRPQMSPPPAPPPPTPMMKYAEAAPAAEEAYDFESDSVEGELARPEGTFLAFETAATGLMDLKESGSGAAMATTPLDLFEQAAQSRPVLPPHLPAMLAGGLDYVYRAATRASVPSGPESHLVPLSAERYPVSTRYETAPALRPVAYLEATVTNDRAIPILQGPIDIFAGADYVGTGALATTGPGGTLELPLGADEDLRIERRVIPKTETEGVFSKEDLTRYRVEIDVANDKRRPVRVRVVEQFPLGGVTDGVEVKRGKTEPAPAEGPDERGHMVFALDIAPGKVGTVRFEYTIRRPADHQLFQQ